ncbi:hypothetical protein HDU97_009240 [Phlyctochytrium planicorne]|nr:hypothetical protein HDU97_009240 [Phlyctochytrium planicorne]
MYDTTGSELASPHKPIASTIARHAHITQVPLWEQRDRLSQKNGSHATVFMINGDRYLGEWKANKKEGNGTYYYNKTGSVYEGEWQYDMRNGYGTFSVPVESGINASDAIAEPSSRSASPASTSSKQAPSKKTGNVRPKTPALRKVFAGEWKNDRRHGFGTYYYEDGSYYEGKWEDDKKEGWGKMNYVDGSVYEGEWHREMRHGQGIYLLPNGDRYEGMWLDDQKEGPGRFIFKTKRQAYEGEWSKGMPKCGSLVDLLPLPGTMPRKYPIPAIKLADPEGLLHGQRSLIQEERMQRMLM